MGASFEHELAGRQHQSDLNALRIPFHQQLALELAIDDLVQQHGPEAGGLRHVDLGPSSLAPGDQEESVEVHEPVNLHGSMFEPQRAVLAGVCRQLMQHEADGLHGARAQHDRRSFKLDLGVLHIG